MMSPRACFVLSAGTSERVFKMLPRRCLVFSDGTSERVFMMLPRESLVFCLARQLSTDLESLEISCRQENSQSAFSAVACVLCTFVLSCLTHPSLRTAQGGHYLSFGRCL